MQMMYFAEAINFSNSESLALLQGFAGLCLAIPALIAGYLALKSRTDVYRKIYFFALIGFLLNLTIFGLLSGVGTRFTKDNVIDTISWIYWAMVTVMLLSSLFMLISSILLLVEWFKNRKTIRSRRT